jgi:predicted metalloprotease
MVMSAAGQLPNGPTRRPADPDAGPAPVRGGADTPDDRFAATVVTGIEQYWRQEFPLKFGRRWPNIQDFMAADPHDAANLPPCLRQSLDLTNQALYCPQLDSVVWDRTTLVPGLRAGYGDDAVVVALAHEMGHAVEDRLGIDENAQAHDPAKYPTILLEGMADCFAGVTLHAVADGQIAGLSANPLEVDQALRGLLSFRDPVGLSMGNGAHGNAFDRASAFINGYDSGAGTCAGMTVADSTFTERPYSSLADASRKGNLALPVLLASMGPDVSDWFSRLVGDRGHPWPAPRLLSGTPCAAAGTDAQGPARSCSATLTVSASRDELAGVYRKYGDYASATVLASRYALAALGAMDRPVLGPDAGQTAICLAGAYTGQLLPRSSGFELSPGDLDEAVDELLGEDLAARDAAGHAPEGDFGLDRVRQFRNGALGGPTRCGL